MRKKRTKAALMTVMMCLGLSSAYASATSLNENVDFVIEGDTAIYNRGSIPDLDFESKYISTSTTTDLVTKKKNTTNTRAAAQVWERNAAASAEITYCSISMVVKQGSLYVTVGKVLEEQFPTFGAPYLSTCNVSKDAKLTLEAHAVKRSFQTADYIGGTFTP